MSAGARHQHAAALDAEALLVALVLDPATYSRNRFFDLYADPAVRRVRRRAALIRSVIRHLCGSERDRAEVLETQATEAGWVDLSYSVPRLGLRRTTRLAPLEMALVRFAIARAEGRCLPAEDADQLRVEGALRCLAESVARRPGAGTSTPPPPPPTTAGTGA